MAEASLITRAAQSAEQGSTFVGTGASALGQTMLWLLVVVGLILLLAWIAKRLGGAHFQTAAGIKMLSVLPVGNKEKIALVQVGEQQLLIGIAPGRVNTLHVFDEAISSVVQQSADAGATPSPQNFRQILVSSLTRKKS